MRFAFTRARTIALITAAYLLAVACGSLIFELIAAAGGYRDGRQDEATRVLAALLTALWVVSVARIVRYGARVRSPRDDRGN